MGPSPIHDEMVMGPICKGLMQITTTGVSSRGAMIMSSRRRPLAVHATVFWLLHSFHTLSHMFPGLAMCDVAAPR